MKRFKSYYLIALAALLLTLFPSTTLAESQPRLRLVVDNPTIDVGQDVTVEIFVENATLIYGVQSNLSFDPDVLEVVALEHGDFLTANPDQEAFILQNRFDNEAGTVDYALSLLNPAPPVEGSGLLATIIFRAKANGEAAIAFRDARFGTQTGDEIMPQADGILLAVGEAAAQALASEGAQDPAPGQVPAPDPSDPGSVPPANEAGAEGSNRLLGLSIVTGLGLIAVIGLFGLAVLVGGWFWLARRRSRGDS